MIYLTGDTHGDFLDERIFFISDLNKNDILIVLGDFGFGWNKQTQDSWSRFRHDCKILFVAGNHENYDHLETLPKVRRFGSEVGDFGNNTYHLKTGKMYTIEGKKFFVYGGARSIDAIYRTPKVSWWDQEIPNIKVLAKAVKTLEKNNYKFDYLLTHTTGEDTVDKLLGEDSYKMFDPVSRHIQTLEDAVVNRGNNFNCNFFGHWHKDEMVDNKHICLFKKVIPLTDNFRDSI